MPVTSHFRTEAEAMLPNGQWLSVVVDLREDAGELIIESSASNNSSLETECGKSSQPSSPNRKPCSPSNRERGESSSTKDLSGGIYSSEADDVLPTESSVRRIEINKGDEGLGISIKGGADHHMPVTVSKIFRGMAADRTRQLFVGDTIISVNNVNLQNATHEEAVRALRSAGHTVIIEVQYAPSATSTSKSSGQAADKAAGGVESVPPLSVIGWGNLTTLTPARQADIPEEPTPETEKTTWWRRVCSLRLAGVQLVSASSNLPQSRASSRNSTIGGPSPDDTTASANRVIRIHSPDLSRTINLRFISPPIAGCWLSWIGATIDRLADRFRDRANSFFSNPASSIAMSTQVAFSFPGQFWQVGWLDSLSPLPFSDGTVNSGSWQRVFAVITDKDFLTFDRAPSLPVLTGHQQDHAESVFKAAISSWLSKHEISRVPLIFSRLVSANQFNHESSAMGSLDQLLGSLDVSSRHLMLGIRIARLPAPCPAPVIADMPVSSIEWRTYRCDSSSSLAIWCRSIVAGCHRAVSIVSTVRFAVLFTGRLCALELSEDRITLLDLEVETGEPAYWSKPWSAIASSSDDGHRLLVFDIQGVGTVDLEVASENDAVGYKEGSSSQKAPLLYVVGTPKPIVFALHSFLSAKLASLGIIA